MSRFLSILFILLIGRIKHILPLLGTPGPNGLSIVFNFHARIPFTLTQQRGIVIPGLTSHSSNCLALLCLRLYLSLSTAPTPTASGLLFRMGLKDNIYFAIVISVHSYMTSALFAFCLVCGTILLQSTHGGQFLS